MTRPLRSIESTRVSLTLGYTSGNGDDERTVRISVRDEGTSSRLLEVTFPLTQLGDLLSNLAEACKGEMQWYPGAFANIGRVREQAQVLLWTTSQSDAAAHPVVSAQLDTLRSHGWATSLSDLSNPHRWVGNAEKYAWQISERGHMCRVGVTRFVDPADHLDEAARGEHIATMQSQIRQAAESAEEVLQQR